MKYQHRVLGMLSLLSVITYLERVCIAVAGPRMQDALTYVVGATANGLGGFVGDWMVRRYGLRSGRRWIGMAGLSVAALSMTAAIVAPTATWRSCCSHVRTAGSSFSSRLSALCAMTSDARTPARSLAS